MRCKERVIMELTEERSSLRERVTEMEEQLQALSTSLLQKERDAEVSVCVRRTPRSQVADTYRKEVLCTIRDDRDVDINLFHY